MGTRIWTTCSQNLEEGRVAFLVGHFDHVIRHVVDAVRIRCRRKIPAQTAWTAT